MLLGLQNVTFEFGARTIVEDATWHIQPNERIALIGYNGTGKSTLLKVLTRQYLPSKGTVEQGRETTIGFLHQDLLSFDTEDSILEVAMGAFERVKQLEKEIEAIGHELEKTGDESLAIEYSEKLHELDVLGGYNIHHKTEEILQGLGFTNESLSKPYKLFSGGWRMSNNLYPFVKTVHYKGKTLYWQNCGMPFEEGSSANWISAQSNIVNPYLGKNHPKYHASMLECGETQDSITAK